MPAKKKETDFTIGRYYKVILARNIKNSSNHPDSNNQQVSIFTIKCLEETSNSLTGLEATGTISSFSKLWIIKWIEICEKEYNSKIKELTGHGA